MSVWSNPSYAIEPLRQATNNLPISCRDEFPKELNGIASFKFGECGGRHPTKAGLVASKYFRENPNEWRKFFDGGKRNLKGAEATWFKNTLSQTNCKLSGIRAVYWAFKQFRSKKWKAPATFEEKDLKEFSGTVYKLGAAPARVNESVWEHALGFYEDDGTEAEGKTWASREALSDAVEYLWTAKLSKSIRKIRKKNEVLHQSLFQAKRQKITISDEAKNLVPKEISHISAFKPDVFDPDEMKRAYNRVMKAIRAKQPVSKSDANAVSILPYKAVPKAGSRLLVFMHKGGLILYDTIENISGFYNRKDWDRLVQMLKSDAKLTLYYSKYDPLERKLSAKMSSAYEEIMASFLRQLDYKNSEKCNSYCRAYDVYQFVYLASLATDVNDRSFEAQYEKVRDEELDKLVDIKEFLSIVEDSEFGVKESLELLKFNKIFPCPDFCTYSVCDNLEKKAMQTHPIDDGKILGSKDGNDVVATFCEFENYMKRNRALNFFDVHGFFPGIAVQSDTLPSELVAYPAIPRHALRLTDMEHINFEGTFHYRSFDGCEDELVKDKVIAPTMRKSDTRKTMDIDPIERNQILKFLFSKHFISQAEVFRMAKDGTLFSTYRNWILLALKPEAKKPESRAFSMAMDEYRRFLSEFEWNVSQYAKKQSGSSIGKSTIDMDTRLGVLSATPMTEYRDGRVLEPVIVSFDLKGFSPMQNPKFKEIGINSWAYAFGKPELKEASKIFTDVEMTFEKFDVTDAFTSRGNDLEGFQGKLNTCTHIDLMGYSVSKLKELGYTVGASSLEVLIDDGLLRVHLELSPHRIEEAIDIMDEVYAFAGQKISWDKTFCSKVLCQYLNRVYYDGIEVTPGAKAFLRIGKKQEIAIPTVVDELMSHASAARGAIQNGAHHMLSYYGYCIEIFKTIRRWGFKRTDDEAIIRMAFAMYVPVGLGGFGISTLYGLSTNESFNAIQSGIASMKMIVHRYSALRGLANSYLNAGVRTMSDESILRNPMSLRTCNRCLNLRRFANAARYIVLRDSTNTLIKKAAMGAFSKLDEGIVQELMRTKVLSEVKRVLLWDMTMMSYVDSVVGKLQTSQTAARVLGFRKAMKVLIANKTECRNLIRETLSGRFSKRSF